MVDPTTLRVWHVIPRDGVGGVEVAARSMAKRDDLDCAFQLCLIAGTAAEPRHRIIGSPYRSLWNPLAHLGVVKKILEARPDIVIFSLWWSVPVALIVRLLAPRSRIVYFLHFDRDTHVLDAMLTRLGVSVASEVWGDSTATLQTRRMPKRIKCRQISFVTERLLPANHQESAAPRFVVWTRLHRQKGLDRAIELIARLVERGVDATFDIWGRDDGELDRLKNLAVERGVDGRVTFHGPLSREGLSTVAASNSFFLQPSRSEGMAMSCVEAMQLGLIPVVTPVGEMKTYVRSGETGIVLDVENLDQGAADIQALMNSPQHYRQVRDNAQKTWHTAPLYSDDICLSSRALMKDMVQ
jgi:glycosyltransferase involved in cell wall biosynthesis